MADFIDKTDGGKGCIDCQHAPSGGYTGGCADCTHKDDIVTECEEINAANARKREHSEPTEKRHFLYDWGYEPLRLCLP